MDTAKLDKNAVVIEVAGGVVQDVYAPPGSTIVIVDWDNIVDDETGKTHGHVHLHGFHSDMPDKLMRQALAAFYDDDGA